MSSVRLIGCMALALAAAACDYDSAFMRPEPIEDERAHRLEVASPRDTLVLPDSVQLTARFLDARGNVVDALPVTWISSLPDIVSVDATGVVRGKTIGSVTVTARSGELFGNILLRVDRFGGWSTLSGHYGTGFETSAFKPCGTGEHWWMTQVPSGVFEFMRDKPEYRDQRPTNSPSGTVYVRWRARATKTGVFGHAGLYQREAQADSLEFVRAQTASDCS